MGMRDFEVRAPGGPYRARVYVRGVDYVRVIFGGRKTDCAIFDIFPGDPEASLTALGYDVRCNLSGDMVQGEGTRDMLRSALTFLAEMLPVLGHAKVERAIFKDKSTVVSAGRQRSYSLWAVSLLQHGKTWYQRHFGARPQNARFEEDLRRCIEEANRPGSLPRWERDIVPYVTSPAAQARVRAAYDQSRSMADLVQRLMGTLKREERMECLHEWPPRWVTKYVNPEMDWIMDLGNVSQHVQEVPVESAPPPATGETTRASVFDVSDPAFFRRKVGGGGHDLFGPMDPELVDRLVQIGFL